MALPRGLWLTMLAPALTCGPAVSDDGTAGDGGTGGAPASSTSGTHTPPGASSTSSAEVTSADETTSLPERVDLGGDAVDDPCLAEAYGCAGILPSKLGPVAHGWGAFIMNDGDILVHVIAEIPGPTLDAWFVVEASDVEDFPVETSTVYWGSYREPGESPVEGDPVSGEVTFTFDAFEPGDPGCVVFRVIESSGSPGTIPIGIYVLPTETLPRACNPPMLPP